MTDRVIEAINEEIAELTDRLSHLKNVRDSYNNPAGATPKLSGKEVGELIIAHIAKANRQDAEWNTAELAHALDVPSAVANRGIRNLLKRGILKDNTPSKSRNKYYALTNKGKRKLFGDEPKPAKGRDNTEAKRRLKDARRSKLSRYQQIIDYLSRTTLFTREEAAEAMGFPSVNACQVTMDRYNREIHAETGKHLYSLDHKGTDGKTAIYKSNIVGGTLSPTPTTPPQQNDNPQREARIVPGEGVMKGRLRA